ncbi:retrovirus-related pol polyprotein from transposon TNT 1-94 [Tanacetum coccineum]
MDLVPREEFDKEIRILSTNYPLFDWKTYVLAENLHVLSNLQGLKFQELQDLQIHILLMDNGIAIHMMIEKKYPLNQEMLSRMLSKRLEVDHESTMAYELLRFIRSQCLKLKTELLNKKDFVEKEIYDKLFKSFTTLEKHCISLEVDTQLNQEIFQRDNSVSNQSAPSFDQLFELNELKAQSQEKDTVIKKLKERIKSLSGKMNEDKIKKDLEEIETINIELDHRVSKLIAENEHLKQTYKQLYDSIKPARIRSKEQCDDLINQVNLKSAEISNLKASLQEKVLVITDLKDDLRKLKGKALVDNDVTKYPSDPEMLKIDVEPITPKLLNKKTTHSAYIKHTQEEAIVLKDRVEHVKSKYPLDHFLESACRYAKLIQELLAHISKTCPSVNNTGVKPSTSASGSQPSGNTKKDKNRQTPSSTQKNKYSKLNAISELKCVKCNGCMLSDNHDLCVLDFINNVNARNKSKSVKQSSKRKIWKLTRKLFTNIRYIWRPTGRTFTIVGNACPLTRITTTTEVPLRKPTALENETPKPVVTLVYSRKPRKSKTNVPISKSKVLKSVSANKKEPSQSWGSIVSDVPSSSLDECRSSKLFSGTVKFRNDHVAKILGYGDYQIGNVMISRVYYVEGLRHNLFSVGQFCDSNLEVAFRQHTCFIRNLEGVDLLTGSRGNNLYTLSLGDMMASSPICLLSKASKTKSWLWHRRLSHLNFGAINHLARHGLVRGLPKLKFEKDHLCSACAMGKSKKKPHKPKSEDTNQEKLYLLHMDLCGPMRVASVNGKKYILVIVDDYSRFTWVKCLRSKDEAPDFIIKFLKMIQVRLKVHVRRIRTDNRTKFVNQTLREYYEKVDISYETSVTRSLLGITYLMIIKPINRNEERRNKRKQDMLKKETRSRLMLIETWQQSGRSEGSRVSSQTLTSKHMDWFTAGLDVPTAKLFLIPTGKLMVPAGSSWFLLVVPAEEYFEEKVAKTMRKHGNSTMSKTRADMDLGIEVILFYIGLDVQTRQILNSKGAIPSKTAADAKDGLAAIQAQLNNLGREIKKVNEKVYAAQLGCEQCKGPHYTKDCPLKEEGKTLKEAYYTQFGGPYQGGGYRAAAPRFYQRNNNTLRTKARGNIKEETLSKELATVKYPKEIAENVLVGIGKFVFPIDFIILDMHEDVNVPLILERPFLSIAHAKIDVFKRKITLRVGDEKIIFKSVKRASSLIKRVYMLSLGERMELDLEARLIGETLVLNRSLDPLYRDYIELNDLNVPLELRRDQVDDLMPTIKEGEVNDEPMIDIIKTRNNESFDEYPIVENMDGYRDQDMGDIILEEPFCKASCVEAKRFDGLITMHNGSDNIMKAGFLDLGGGGGKMKNSKDSVIPSVMSDSGNATIEVELPSVVDETVVKEKQCPVVNTTGLGSYPPPSMHATSAGNAPGKSSYANVIGKPSGKKLNFRTLFTPGGNGKMWLSGGVLFIFPDENLLKDDVSTIPVWVKLHGVPITAFSEDGDPSKSTRIIYRIIYKLRNNKD